jgi:CRISPR-associated endonuclease/helicase Cas3
MPGDARLLIEGVYGEKSQEEIPETLLGLCWNAEGEAGSKRGMACLNALKLEKGYTRASAEDSGGWDKETRIPTRLGDESITVALVRLDDGSLKPYAEASEFAWELSMINLPKRAWRKAQEKIPISLQGAIDKLKEEVKLLKWVEVLPLTEELSRYYDPQMGWGLSEEESDESNQ